MMPPRKDPNVYIDRIKEVGKGRFEFLGWDGEYAGCATKARLRCIVDGYEWSARSDSLFSSNQKQGCGVCSGTLRYDQDTITNMVISASAGRYSVIGWVDGLYKNRRSRVILKCNKCDNTWSPEVRHHIKDDCGGCPRCATSGFDSNAPASFYVYEWKHENGDVFYKYGVTNRNVCDRIKQQKRCTEYIPTKIHVASFGTGLEAKRLELAFSEKFSGSNVSQDVFRDGWTETFRSTDISSDIESILTTDDVI